MKLFKSPKKEYTKFKTIKSGNKKSPSAKRSDYESRAIIKSDLHSRCIFVDSNKNKRCKLYLGIYPKYCHIHTILIENLYISKSNIKNGGNGLFSGPIEFKKDEIIGEYSYPSMEVKSGRLDIRNGKGKDVNYDYILCLNKEKGQLEKDILCYDGLDKNSSIIRNANDAHNSEFKNNCYFYQRKTKSGKYKVLVVCKKKIKPFSEILIDYGNNYFNF